MSTDFKAKKYVGPLFRRCTRRLPDPKRPGKTVKCANRTHFHVSVGDFGFAGDTCQKCAVELFTAFASKRGT